MTENNGIKILKKTRKKTDNVKRMELLFIELERGVVGFGLNQIV